jgi:DNA helicase-2/ATP-dependent DNA helicase PcrA
VKFGGLKFLDAAHVKDMLALLRFVENPRDRVAGFRVMHLLPGVGPASAQRILDRMAEATDPLDALTTLPSPPRAGDDWTTFVETIGNLRYSEWPADLERARLWYEPHLDRIHEDAEVRRADLIQLEQIAGGYASRERFLTELTLDPPMVTGDKAAGANKDEDYVILSTIHSAKGQEWDIVYVLNVSDGNFPSEFSTGKPEMIEEERRLLYVAMTRARNELHLCAPLKYQVTQQAKDGDKHVYGAKSRFMTDKLLDTCEKISLRNMRGIENLKEGEAATVDVVAQLKEMW